MKCNDINIRVKDPMDFENAVHIVNGLLLTHTGKELKDSEVLVLKASWEDVGYEEIVEIGRAHV